MYIRSQTHLNSTLGIFEKIDTESIYMNSGMHLLVVYPIINRNYGNNFNHRRIWPNPFNRQYFHPNNPNQQGLCGNPSN